MIFSLLWSKPADTTPCRCIYFSQRICFCSHSSFLSCSARLAAQNDSVYTSLWVSVFVCFFSTRLFIMAMPIPAHVCIAPRVSVAWLCVICLFSFSLLFFCSVIFCMSWFKHCAGLSFFCLFSIHVHIQFLITANFNVFYWGCYVKKQQVEKNNVKCKENYQFLFITFSWDTHIVVGTLFGSRGIAL